MDIKIERKFEGKREKEPKKRKITEIEQGKGKRMEREIERER